MADAQRVKPRCILCGSPSVPFGNDPLDAECLHCNARSDSMHLASMMLAAIGGGRSPTLAALASSPGDEPVLDCSGDWVVEKFLRQRNGYVARDLLADAAGADAPFGAALLAELERVDAGAFDVAAFRNVLRVVPELPPLLAAVRRLLRPGGIAIFQDRFAHPWPEHTSETASPDAFQVVQRRTSAHLAGFVEEHLPVRRVLGADFVSLLERHGLEGFVDRPLIPVAVSSSRMAILARAR